VSDVSIGTVSSEVRLNLTKLEGDVSEAKAALASLAASLVGAVETFSAKMAQDASAAVAREERAAQAAIQRAAQQAEAQQKRSLAAAQQIGGQLQMMGTVAVGALGMAVKTGADFEQKLVTVANNTTMTTADIKAMEEAVKSLGRESGADLGQLAEGFMHASNFGFDAAESTMILTEAMRSAVSTGGDVGKTTEILANVMHEFSIKSGDAGKAMNVLHLAAAQGNATLEQFVDAGGPAFAMAANLGVGMTETAAAMSALTKHGFTAAEAATQVRNILAHIAEPASKTKDLLEQLSKTTGVDLVRDFSLAGLQGKGMAGILDDIKLAAEKAHISTEDLMMKLVPAMRGGIGAMALAGTAASDFKQELKSLSDAMAGTVDPTTAAFARQQDTLTAQTNKARNELTLMASDIQKALLPAIRPMIQAIRDGAEWFSKLSPQAKSAAVQLAAFAGAAALVTGTVLKTITAVAELKAALSALSLMKVSLPSVGGLAAGGLGGIGLAGAGLLAAGGGLGYLMNRTVWSGVEEAQNRAFAQDRHAQEQTSAWRTQRAAFLAKDIAGLKASLKDYEGVPSKLADINKRLAQETAEMRAVFGDDGGNSSGSGKKGGGHKTVDQFLASAGGGGGAGGKGGGGSDAKEAIQEVQDALYKLTHSDYEVRMREAWKDLNEEIRKGVPALLARQLYTRQLADIEKDQAADRAKMGGTMAQAVRNMQAQDAANAKRENDEITASIRAVVDAYTAEAAELESVKQATDEADRAAQQMFDNQIADMLRLMEAQRLEAEATAQYWKDVQDEQEATFRARIEQSAIAAKAEQDERDQTEQYHKDNPDIGKKPQTQLQKVLRQMGGDIQSILGGAFEKVFLGDTKNLLGDLLKSFEQMLAKMVADAVAAGIVRSLFGGGNFVTGFMGSLLGGFDDAGNDRTARHWGFDFASMFTQGMSDHSTSRMAAAAPGGSSGGDTHVHINIQGPVVRHDLDIRDLSRQVAREVQNGLRARPGTGARA